MVHDDEFPVKDVAELIDYAKKNPGKLRYGTVGVGSYPHYDMAYFAKRAGDLDAGRDPQQGGRRRASSSDMVTGDTQAAFLNVASTAAQVQAGKIRPIAVGQPHAPAGISGRADHEGGRASGRRHDRLERACSRPPRTPKPVLESLHQRRRRQRCSRRCRQGGAGQAELQHRALEVGGRGARLWLAGEINAWKKITDRGEDRSGGCSLLPRPVSHGESASG